jgi:hypothetical protein
MLSKTIFIGADMPKLRIPRTSRMAQHIAPNRLVRLLRP